LPFYRVNTNRGERERSCPCEPFKQFKREGVCKHQKFVDDETALREQHEQEAMADLIAEENGAAWRSVAQRGAVRGGPGGPEDSRPMAGVPDGRCARCMVRTTPPWMAAR